MATAGSGQPTARLPPGPGVTRPRLARQACRFFCRRQLQDTPPVPPRPAPSLIRGKSAPCSNPARETQPLCCAPARLQSATVCRRCAAARGPASLFCICERAAPDAVRQAYPCRCPGAPASATLRRQRLAACAAFALRPACRCTAERKHRRRLALRQTAPVACRSPVAAPPYAHGPVGRMPAFCFPSQNPRSSHASRQSCLTGTWPQAKESI